MERRRGLKGRVEKGGMDGVSVFIYGYGKEWEGCLGRVVVVDGYWFGLFFIVYKRVSFVFCFLGKLF